MLDNRQLSTQLLSQNWIAFVRYVEPFLVSINNLNLPEITRPVLQLKSSRNELERILSDDEKLIPSSKFRRETESSEVLRIQLVHTLSSRYNIHLQVLLLSKKSLIRVHYLDENINKVSCVITDRKFILTFITVLKNSNFCALNYSETHPKFKSPDRDITNEMQSERHKGWPSLAQRNNG
jgi:hypothetical protein